MPLTYTITKRLLLDKEFVLDHQIGSHQVRKKGKAVVVLPHKSEFATGTGRSIIKRIAQIIGQDNNTIIKNYNIKF
jgi:predicted RNA binding protein YcfA (HicA-like mRNA interferase family)